METKKLGLGSAVATCVGLIVATSCLLSLGQGIGLAGPAFIIPLFIVMILNAFLAMSMSELHTLMPKVEGGIGQYTLAGLGPVASIISNTSAYVICMVLAVAVEVTMCGTVLSQTLLPAVPAPVLSIAVLGILFLLNFRGIDMFSRVQNLVVTLLIGSIAVLGVISFFKLVPDHVIAASAQTAPSVVGFGGLMGLSAMAFWLFIGVEFVIPLANDLKNPKRDVLLSMILGLVMLFVVQALMGAGMANYVTLDELASADMPHIVFAEHLLGKAGVYWMSIVTLLAGISTTNTVLASVSRILSGMAESEMMPKIFMKKSRYGTAPAGMLLVAIAIIVLIVTGYTNSSGLVNIILAASCFWLVSYIIVHTNVLVLRRKYPNAPRVKWLMLGGVPQIIGILGNIYMIWNISSDMQSRMQIYSVFGVLFVILTAYAFFWIKVVKRAPAFTPVSIENINNYTMENPAPASLSAET